MLSSVIGRFTSGNYVITRALASTNVMGRAVAGTATALAAVAMSVQPATGRALKLAPEGATADDVRVIYTTTQLYTLTDTYAPDRITIGGDTFVVYKVETFGILSGGHYRAYASRINIP